jgi:hypothetical protein
MAMMPLTAPVMAAVMRVSQRDGRERGQQSETRQDGKQVAPHEYLQWRGGARRVGI